MRSEVLGKTIKRPKIWDEILNMPLTFSVAPLEVRDNYEFVRSVVSTYPATIQWVSPRLANYKPLALLAVQLNGFALEHVSPKFKDDLEIVKIALNTASSVIQYASERIQNMEEIGLSHVKHSSLVYLGKELKDNEKVVLASIDRDPSNLMYASQRLRLNLDFNLKAFERNSNVFMYLNPQIKDNLFFCLRVGQVEMRYDSILFIDRKRSKEVRRFL